MNTVNPTSHSQMPVILCVRFNLYAQISRWHCPKLATTSKQSILDEGRVETLLWKVCWRGGRMGNSSAFFVGQLDSVLTPWRFRDCYLDPAGSPGGSQSLWWSSPAQTQVWFLSLTRWWCTSGLLYCGSCAQTFTKSFSDWLTSLSIRTIIIWFHLYVKYKE